jgi:hypothetical protein
LSTELQLHPTIEAAAAAAAATAADAVNALAPAAVDPKAAAEVTKAIASAAATAAANAVQPAVADAKKEGESTGAQETAEKKFLGINLGVGFGVSLDLDGGDQVDEAVLDEAGIVRVKKESNQDPRILFEIHKFFEKGPGCFLVADEKGTILSVKAYEERTGSTFVQPPGCDGGDKAVFKGKSETLARWGHGPFAAIQSTPDNALAAFGVGWMIGWRKEGDNSFNIGAGFLVDRDVKTLGEGMVENRPLPAGETMIRIKEESRTGFMVLTSFSF